MMIAFFTLNIGIRIGTLIVTFIKEPSYREIFFNVNTCDDTTRNYQELF